MLSLHQLISRIETFKGTNAILSNGTFLFGDTPEYGADTPIVYPLTGSRFVGSNLTDTKHITTLNLYFADLTHKEGFQGNVPDVLSDMQIAGLRLYSELKNDLETTYPIKLDVGAITPFTERWDDEVTGIEFNITFEQFYDLSSCN